MVFRVNTGVGSDQSVFFDLKAARIEVFVREKHYLSVPSKMV